MNIQRADYLARECPRLRYLLRIFNAEGLFAEANVTRPRFIVVCHWPIVAWLVEMFLRALSLNYVTIAAGSSMDDRSDAATKFTDPRSSCTVLLTTYNLGGMGLDLHRECSRVVLMEPALNLNAEFQAIGRVYRLGQREPQKVWRLFQDYTIAHWVEWNSQRRILPQVAAQHQQAFAHALVSVLPRDGPDAAGLPDSESGMSDEDAGVSRSVVINSSQQPSFVTFSGWEEGRADRDSLGDVHHIGTIIDQDGLKVSNRVPINTRTRSRFGKRRADGELEGSSSKRRQVNL